MLTKRTPLPSSLLEDFDAIQMARPPETLRRFVVGAQSIDHPAQGWAQCVLELSIKYNAIRRAEIQAQIIALDMEEELAKDTPRGRLEAAKRTIDLEEQNAAQLGAEREFASLYAIYQEFPQRYTREQLDAAQVEYWQNRIGRQAQQDQESRQTGIGAGNLEAMRELGLSSATNLKEIAAVEQRYLEAGKQRLLIVTLVADADQPESVPALQRAWEIPTTVERRLHCIHGMTIDAGYTEAVMTAVREGATHLMCVEDDTFPPLDAIERLLAHNVDIVGGWYPKRQPGPRVGVPIVIRDGTRQTFDDPEAFTGLVEVHTIPMGCTLIRVDVFTRVPMPWFVTTGQLSQDSFFSQRAREAGYTLWCDPTLRCVHTDRTTGVEFH